MPFGNHEKRTACLAASAYSFLKYLCEIKNSKPEIKNIATVKAIFNSIINPQSSMSL
jgi:hypothetical protein